MKNLSFFYFQNKNNERCFIVPYSKECSIRYDTTQHNTQHNTTHNTQHDITQHNTRGEKDLTVQIFDQISEEKKKYKSLQYYSLYQYFPLSVVCCVGF